MGIKVWEQLKSMRQPLGWVRLRRSRAGPDDSYATELRSGTHRYGRRVLYQHLLAVHRRSRLRRRSARVVPSRSTVRGWGSGEGAALSIAQLRTPAVARCVAARNGAPWRFHRAVIARRLSAGTVHAPSPRNIHASIVRASMGLGRRLHFGAASLHGPVAVALSAAP